MPALEAGVVLGADAREEGDLLAPEARHAPVPPIGWNAGPVRGQPGSSRCQELSDLALDAQVIHGLAARRLEGGTDSTLIRLSSLVRPPVVGKLPTWGEGDRTEGPKRPGGKEGPVSHRRRAAPGPPKP